MDLVKAIVRKEAWPRKPTKASTSIKKTIIKSLAFILGGIALKGTYDAHALT